MIMSSNKHELIGRRQQSGVLIALWGKIVKLVTASGSDFTGLG